MAHWLELYIEQSGDSVIQNMFYNEWKSDHYIKNVLVFVRAGHIIAAIFNDPGHRHDFNVLE